MLQCQLCNKPFTNPSSHTRHRRYCLKTRNRPRVRQKSCVACSASKVKCTFQRPSCARCHKKGTECAYDNEARPSPDQVKTPSLTNIEPAHFEFQPWGQEISESNQLIDWTAIDLFLSDDFSLPTIVDLGLPAQPGFVTKPSPITDDISQRQHQSNAVTTTASSPAPSITNTADHASISTPLTISPSTPVIHPSILTLHQNPHITIPTNAATKYSLISIIRGLRSYPLMMTQKETFPPIIHPHLLGITSNNPNNTQGLSPREIISRCMSLSHRYAMRTPETAPYLWDALIDQSNLFIAHFTSSSGSTAAPFSSASLIAAIQAQLIYVIMRIVDCSSPKATSSSEGTSDTGSRNRELNLNYSVMYVFKKLCETFVERFGSEAMYFDSYTSHHFPLHHSNLSSWQADQSNPPSIETANTDTDTNSQDWENWIVSESWRRMKIIFFLIEKIVVVNMGASVKCTSRYADVDWIMLPCTKALWEARSETEWEARLHNSAAARLGFGSRGDKLETVGGLLRAHEGAMNGELGNHGEDSGMRMNRYAELLDRWNVEADGLGALLNASLGTV